MIGAAFCTLKDHSPWFVSHEPPPIHPCEYKYSSSAFYELQTNLFPFLKDLRNEF